ncbi:hypothetical protein AZE42_09092 [Rhizopogon vesiculosus]|uniref:Uncharacterized protein n=1 Tax=Rhizopogon vesiculosus TaxID=180088 RepID=A0A1J8QKI0_9AGAM|nr:hypothetical protein AZE42_09092 [Rhizopogon vesiculosus]
MKSPMGLDIRFFSLKANRKHVFFIPSSHLCRDNSLGFMLQHFTLSVFLRRRSAHGESLLTPTRCKNKLAIIDYSRTVVSPVRSLHGNVNHV